VKIKEIQNFEESWPKEKLLPEQKTPDGNIGYMILHQKKGYNQASRVCSEVEITCDTDSIIDSLKDWFEIRNANIDVRDEEMLYDMAKHLSTQLSKYIRLGKG